MDDGLNISAGPEDLRVKFEAAARRIIKVDVARYQGLNRPLFAGDLQPD